MEPDKEQRLRVEQLVENESLTDNLTDTQAQALLEWAEKQIASDTDFALVKAAVRAANTSGEVEIEPLLARAAAFLNSSVGSRGTPVQTPHDTASHSPTVNNEPNPEITNDASAGAALASTPFGSPDVPLLPAPAESAPPPLETTPPRKKKRSKSRRKK